MSRFLNSRHEKLEAYVPGEQPQNQKYIKLNTNENPFPPAPDVIAAIEEESKRLNLYSDPECNVFLNPFASYLGLQRNQVFAGNGSDEVLAIIFQSLCEERVAFADITYGFYKVYAELYGLNAEIIPLRSDLTIDPTDYYNLNCTIVIANPNAPTGTTLKKEEIRGICENNNSLIVIDEAYIDFTNESVIELLKEYSNLLVVGTFSKSRSLAGARLGYAASNSEIIKDMNKIKFSINPYNVNRMTLAAAAASLKDNDYYEECIKTIVANREYLKEELKKYGFSTLDSKANFIFTKHERVKGQTIYLKLKEKGILVRWFSGERIKDYLRISIGTRDDICKLIEGIKEILEEEI